MGEVAFSGGRATCLRDTSSHEHSIHDLREIGRYPQYMPERRTFRTLQGHCYRSRSKIYIACREVHDTIQCNCVPGERTVRSRFERHARTFYMILPRSVQCAGHSRLVESRALQVGSRVGSKRHHSRSELASRPAFVSTRARVSGPPPLEARVPEVEHKARCESHRQAVITMNQVLGGGTGAQGRTRWSW